MGKQSPNLFQCVDYAAWSVQLILICTADVIWGWNVVRSAKPAHDCSIDVFKGMRGSGVVQCDIN